MRLTGYSLNYPWTRWGSAQSLRRFRVSYSKRTSPFIVEVAKKCNQTGSTRQEVILDDIWPMSARRARAYGRAIIAAADLWDAQP